MHAVIDKYANAETLDQCWRYLTAEMRRFGFDRILYARKPHATRNNIHNHSDTIILSTYGPEAEDYFIRNRRYMFDVTTNLALERSGPISWSVSAARHESGQMSDEEAAVHLETQALGLVAGYTYSTLNAVDRSASGFGLCFEHGFDQDHVDSVWQANENAIVSQLQLFELCVRRVPHIQRDRSLTPRQRIVLRWAAEGKTIGQIAQILKISQRTVEKHMKGARDTLAVGTTLEAVLSASNQGQI